MVAAFTLLATRGIAAMPLLMRRGFYARVVGGMLVSLIVVYYGPR